MISIFTSKRVLEFLKKICLEIFEKNSADKIWFNKDLQVKVPYPVPDRVKLPFDAKVPEKILKALLKVHIFWEGHKILTVHLCKQIEFPYLRTVLLAIPINKLLWFNSSCSNMFNMPRSSTRSNCSAWTQKKCPFQ